MTNNDDDFSGDVPDFSSFGSPIDSGSSDAAPTPAPRRPSFAWAPEVDDALEQASKEHGVDRGLLDTFARIESSGRANARTGSYKGLFQLSDDEFRKHGGQSDPYDPYENARAGASKLSTEKADFSKRYGREPSAAELYMIHQQGVGGAAAHWANPDAPAWQNMYSTGEGRQKGANWARRAIWGNVPDDVKRQYGSVDNLTSRDFVKLWEDKVARFGSGSTSGSFPVASGPAPSAPSSGPIDLAGLSNIKASAAPGQRMSLGGPPVSDDDEEETEGANPLLTTSYDDEDEEEASADPETDGDAGPMYLGGPDNKPDFSKYGKPLGKAATPAGTSSPDFSKFGKPVAPSVPGKPVPGAAPVLDDNDPAADVAVPDDRYEITKGFVGGLIGQNPKVFGDALIGLGELSESPKLVEKGEEISKWGKDKLEGYKARVPSYRDIRTDTWSNFMSDVGSYSGYAFGQGTASAAPGLVVGGATSMATANPLVGLAVGAAGPSYIQNFGDVYGSAREDKDIQARVENGELTKKGLAGVSAMAAVPMAALDILSLETIVGKTLMADAKKGLVKEILKGVATGAITEGSTEGLQEVISQWAQHYLGSQTGMREKFDSVVDNMFAGALTGGGMSAAGTVAARARGNPTPEPPKEEEAQKALAPPPKQITGPQGEQPAQESMPPAASDEEAGWLRAQGWDDNDIAEMPPEQRAAEIEQAKAQGLKPVAAPAQAPQRVPDNPSAEPVTDLLAQATDLNDPKSDRSGVYVPASSLDALDDKGAEKLAQAMGDNLVLQNFDDKGGHLVVADYETAKKALEDKAKGEDLQKIIGEATGAGSGKPVNGSIVVQQRTKDGAVVRESLVTPDKADATAKAFARAGHDVEVMSAQEALQRREEMIAAQRAAAPAQAPSTRTAPVTIEKPEDVAAVVAPSDYSPAQGEANNRRLGHAKWNGLDISIETDADNVRRGQTKEGSEWKSRMGAPYGYFKGTTGNDDMHVDVFVGPNPTSDAVYVLDENDKKTGKFRQHKTFIGFDTEADVRKAYASSTNKSEDQIGGITEMDADIFKDWLAEGKKTKPAAEEFKGVDEPKAPRRWDGPELSNDDIDLIVTNWKFVRDVAAMTRPETLTQFVIAHGGLQDGAREVRHIMGAAKERPGLVNKGGVSLDDMALKAWESGFFEDSERPTIADFLDKLQDDLHTGTAVRLIDQDALDSIKIAGEIAEELNDYGITASKFRSEASLREYFGQARAKAARAAEDAEGPEAKGRESADRSSDPIDEVPFGSEPEGQQGSVDDGQAAERERAGRVRDTEDQDQQGAEPAKGARDSGEDRGPAGTRQAGRGSDVAGARETGPSDSRGADQLADYRGQHIDGYNEDGEQKHRFLTDARNYLTKVAKILKAEGFEAFPDKKGKPGKPVSVNQAGPAVSGEVSLNLIDADGNGVYAQISGSVGTLYKGETAGVRLFARRASESDRYGAKATNQWLEDDLTAPDLAEMLLDIARPPRAPAAITTEKSGQTSLVPEPTTKEKIAAEAKAKARKGGNEAMDVGMFGSEKDQTDLVDMAKAEPKKPSRLGQGLSDLMGKSGGQAKAVETVAAGAKAPTETATPQQKLVDRLLGEGFKGILDARKFAKENGLDGSNKEIDETVERAVVTAARQIVAEGKDPSETFQALVALYGRQPNLASRTGTSVANQAYSTPMPLAYLASRLAGAATADVVYEPTAGNGALLMEAGPGNDAVYANEIDPDRAAALEGFGFTVSQEDGSEPRKIEQPADAIVANPPFGAVKEGGQSRVFKVGDWNTTQIDHAVSLHALDNLTANGRAVLILGGTKSEATEERRKDYRGKAKREFYARLYKDYNVTDHFTVSGDLYTKQGASWPVDVIVIDGRGKSERKLPAAQPPVILKTWDQVAEKLPNGEAGRNELASRPVDRPAGKPDRAGAEPASSDASDRTAPVGRGSERVQPEAEGKPAAVRAERAQRESRDVGSRGNDDAAKPASDRNGGRVGDAADTKPVRPRVKREAKEGASQVPYEPVSTIAALDTLIPVNMATPAREAMKKVEERRGSLDDYVADRLGYESDAEGPFFIDADGTKQRPFAAEQIDALAAAIDNIERGSAFVNGAQTGIGKGRTAAGVLRYAMKKGLTPVFLTEKPDLYGDMYRDLRDIGVPEMLGREPRMFITNAGETITLDEDALSWKQESEETRRNGEPAPKKRGKFLVGGTAAKVQDGMKKIANGDDIADVVFTTYDQLNTVKGASTPRRAFLSQIAPQSIVVMDEAHTAGGQPKTGWEKKDAVMNRADFARELAAKAKGVMFSSATYAKRPDVMDLYARTDMGKAVDDPKDLGELIQRGGVPMQQIVASMLAKSGQYMRHERSFDGVDYQLTPVPVNLKAYKQFSASMQAIFRFDLAVEEFRDEWGQDKLDELGWKKSKDDGVGGGSASSVAFGSLMHNITNQMLLAIKAEATAKQAIEAHKAGEKPVIALANTNESFIKDFAESEDIKIGQALDLDFSAVLERYLQRTLQITVKGPDKETKRIKIPVDDLPLSLRQEFRAAMNAIKDGDYSSLPISPIDWIRHRLGEAGMSVKEVTGRQTMIDYSKPVPTYIQRPKSEMGASGKRGSISYFNAGKLDALILNRSGSTGVSMHASKDFKDKRKRRMILAQAEGNIDTHLQMLGRVHRTGQVIPPAYSQIAAEIPAEARPTAVLMKKMASLNANTTGARSSAFTVDSVDFINEVGDKVVADILQEDPDLNEQLGEPLKFEENGKAKTEEISRKATGRLVLLDPDVQTRFLDQVQKAYLAEIEQLDALGDNPLEAKTVDLQAKTVESSELKPKQGDSPFLDSVRMEKVTAKAQGRAMAPSDVATKIADALKVSKPAGSDAQVLAALEAQGRAWGYKETDRVSALIRKQMSEEIAETGADSKESTRRRLEAQFQRWNETMDLVHPGARVRLGMPAGDLDAVVMSVERTGKAKQMGALSAWTVKFAVPDSMRQLDFPMSKLFPPNTTKADDEKGATLTRAGASHNDLVDAFEQARKEGRETRYIMTGNILGGFDQTRGRGRIVNFTDDKGELRPGILMGREFSAEKFMDARAVRFQNAGQIIEFMGKAPLAHVEASLGSIELSQYRDTYRIEMASARAKAGQFFTDAAVRRALGDKEFEKRGSKMIVDGLTKAEFTKAVAEMQKIGAKFEVRDQQDLAQSIVSKQTGEQEEAEGLPVMAVNPLPSGNFKSAIPDIRQAMGSVLKAGRPVSVKREIVDAVHAAIGSVSRMVPKGTRVFALTRVEPTGNGDRVIASFEDRDGYETKIKFPWASLSGMRAFYFNGHVHIVRLNARSLRAAEEFDGHVTAELGHEVIHALRRGNVLVGDTWGRLLAHAKSLRLLDGDFGTYARIVGDLSADMVPDGTVRNAYEQFYNTRSDRSEMMDEEEVAHMMEWYLRGILSPAEVAPVRDLLDAIERGEVADISTESQLEAEMAFAVSQAAQAQRRELDRLGFYSKALEAAKGLRQAKGTPEQMRAMLRTAGVKEAELKATGLDEWLAERARAVSGEEAGRSVSLESQQNGDRTERQPDNRRSREPIVTKDELVRFLRENRVEVKEGTYGDEQGDFPVRMVNGRAEMFDAITGNAISGPAKWQSYSIDPSNPTYRETVIHLPGTNYDTALANLKAATERLDAFEDAGKADTPEHQAAQAEYDSALAIKKKLDKTPYQNDFESGHWSEPNVVAHARTSLQKTADGKTVFLVDELQSDWGQKIRDGGGRDERKIAELRKRLEASEEAGRGLGVHATRMLMDTRWSRDEAVQWLRKEDPTANDRTRARDLRSADELASLTPEQIAAIKDRPIAEAELRTAEASAPGHPLVNTTDQWTTTAFRRLIRQAVEAGADYIALTPGKVQNERFNLSKVVREIEVERGPGLRYVYLYGPNGDNISRIHVNDDGMVTDGQGAGSPLADVVGRDVAAKIMGVAEKEVLKTADIEIGGSGMKATYDSIYPRTLGKLLGKMDPEAGKMADKELHSSVDGREFRGKGFTENQVGSQGTIPFHTFPLTDKVKESVREEGQPMFAIGGASARTAQASSRETAQAMERRRQSPAQILRDTGWFRGRDGKWRFEIDDSKAALATAEIDWSTDIYDGVRKRYQGDWNGRLADFYQHPDLYAAYPELAKASLSVGLGSYYGDSGRFNNGSLKATVNDVDNLPKLKSIIAHEIQHWIQEREGFSPGSSPAISSQMNAIAISDLKAELLRAEEGKAGHNRIAAIKEAIDALETSQMLMKPDWWGSTPAEGAYRNVYGEVEARNVQSRLDMTADERVATPPWRTEDVAPADIIMRGATRAELPNQDRILSVYREVIGSRPPLKNNVSIPLSEVLRDVSIKGAAQALSAADVRVQEAARAVADVIARNDDTRSVQGARNTLESYETVRMVWARLVDAGFGEPVKPTVRNIDVEGILEAPLSRAPEASGIDRPALPPLPQERQAARDADAARDRLMAAATAATRDAVTAKPDYVAGIASNLVQHLLSGQTPAEVAAQRTPDMAKAYEAFLKAHNPRDVLAIKRQNIVSETTAPLLPASALFGARAAGSVIPRAGVRQQAVSNDIAEAINIVNRIAGRDVEVRFSETMDLASVSLEQVQATERAGIDADVRGSYRRPTLDARAVITLATGKDDLLTTAGHEAWHHVEERLASEAEKRLLKAPSEMRRMRTQAAAEIGMDVADPRLAQIPDSEIRAIAFQKYRREREEGQQPQGIHMGVRRFFDRMLKILAVVRNALAGHGLKTYEDVFEAARTGEISERAGKTLSPDAKNDGNVRQDEALAAVPQDVNDVMASLIPRVIQQSVARTMRRFEVGERVDRLRVGIQDKFLPVRRMQEEKEIQTGTKIPINLDTYVAEALFHGRAGEQTADLKTDYIEPLIETLRKADISKEQFDAYLYARHAAERNAAIAKIDPGNLSGSGMTDQEANSILAGARAKQAAYDQAAKLVDTMLEETRKRLLRSGLISREQFDAWSSQYANYVPLRGFEAGQDEPDRPRSGRGFDIRGPEAMQALGRRSKADSPLAYALMQAQQSIIRAEKNRVDKTLYRFIQAYPDPQLYQIYRGEYRRRLNPVTKQVESYWVAPQFVRDDAVHGVKIGGKQYYMELKDAGLARAMRGVQGEQHNAVLRGMMWLSRTYASLLTSYNPEFVVSNFMRDIQTALANVTDVADKPAGVRRQMLKDAVSMKSIRGVLNALRGDGNAEYARWFEEYRQAGGKISFMEFNDVDRIQRDVTKSIERGRFNRVTRKALDLINDLNTAVENGVRLSTYIAMRKAGIGQDRAAYVARELTVNFNRKGEWSPVINSMYLFFNASVQGTTRMAQAIAKSRTLQVGVASIVGAAFMVDWWNYMVAGDDDDGKNRYDKIPAWIKERNLIVMTGRADGSYVQIPMPYGYNLFWLGGQQTAAVMRGAVKPHEAAVNMGKAMFEVMSPIGGANGSVAQMAAPTMVDPFIQVIENKTWYGGPIYPTKYNKNLPDSENAFSSVNPWFQAIARKLNSLDVPIIGTAAQALGMTAGNTARKGTIDVSPEVIEHFFEFAGGGLAKFMNNASTAGSRVIHGEEWLPEKTPFVRRVYGKATTESRRGDFYAAWEEVDAAKFEIDNLIKNTRKGTAGQDEIAAAREKNAVELQAYGFMRDTQRALSAMRKERATIDLNRDLTRAEKEEKLKEIQNRENGLILRSLGNLNRLKKQSKQPPQAEAAE